MKQTFTVTAIFAALVGNGAAVEKQNAVELRKGWEATAVGGVESADATLEAEPASPKTGRQLGREGTPQEVGLDREAVARLEAEVRSGEYGYVDSLLVVRNGRMVFERSYSHDYRRIYARTTRYGSSEVPDSPTATARRGPASGPYHASSDLHTVQSITKSITGLVVAVAASRREFVDLDTPVLQFFDEAQVANVDERKRRMTVWHLLTMTAGLKWNEEVPYRDPLNTASHMNKTIDWAKFAIDQPMAVEPGTEFTYNSGASQLLSHVFKAAVGVDIQDYAKATLFGPIGITNYYWDRAPNGLTDTKGGLFLRPRELAKIGQLLLQGGTWNDTQVLDADSARQLTSPAVVATRPKGSDYRYGYQWWLIPYGRYGDHLAWVAIGFGGQRLIIVPEQQLIVVILSWSIRADAVPVPPIRRLIEGLSATFNSQSRE